MEIGSEMHEENSMQVGPEPQPQTPGGDDPMNLMTDSCSSLIKLDAEASEGESLDSNVLKVAMLAHTNHQQSNNMRVSHSHSDSNDASRSSHQIAESMLKNKSKKDSEKVLAKQIESLRDMEKQNEMLTSQVRLTMQKVTNIEKTLRKKQAESQTELEILRIKYGNLKVNYRSVDMQNGIGLLQYRASQQLSQNNQNVQQMPFNQQSCGQDDSEVIIGKHSVDYQQHRTGNNANNNFSHFGKMSPLAFHKLQNTGSPRNEPTPSTRCGNMATQQRGVGEDSCNPITIDVSMRHQNSDGLINERREEQSPGTGGHLLFGVKAYKNAAEVAKRNKKCQSIVINCKHSKLELYQQQQQSLQNNETADNEPTPQANQNHHILLLNTAGPTKKHKSAPLKSSQSTFVTSNDNNNQGNLVQHQQQSKAKQSPTGKAMITPNQQHQLSMHQRVAAGGLKSSHSSYIIEKDQTFQIEGIGNEADYRTPTDKKPPKSFRKMKTNQTVPGHKDQQSTSESESLCHSDELTIVKEHMNFIVGLLIAPDFKRIVNWLNLTSKNVSIDDQQFEVPSLRNFIILTALKIQQLIGDLKESKELNLSLQKKHRKWKEQELESEIQIATIKDNYERELEALKATQNGPIILNDRQLSSNHSSSQKNLLRQLTNSNSSNLMQTGSGNGQPSHNMASVWLKGRKPGSPGSPDSKSNQMQRSPICQRAGAQNSRGMLAIPAQNNYSYPVQRSQQFALTTSQPAAFCQQVHQKKPGSHAMTVSEMSKHSSIRDHEQQAQHFQADALSVPNQNQNMLRQSPSAKSNQNQGRTRMVVVYDQLKEGESIEGEDTFSSSSGEQQDQEGRNQKDVELRTKSPDLYQYQPPFRDNTFRVQKTTQNMALTSNLNVYRSHRSSGFSRKSVGVSSQNDKDQDRKEQSFSDESSQEEQRKQFGGQPTLRSPVVASFDHDDSEQNNSNSKDPKQFNFDAALDDQQQQKDYLKTPNTANDQNNKNQSQQNSSSSKRVVPASHQSLTTAKKDRYQEHQDGSDQSETSAFKYTINESSEKKIRNGIHQPQVLQPYDATQQHTTLKDDDDVDGSFFSQSDNSLLKRREEQARRARAAFMPNDSDEEQEDESQALRPIPVQRRFIVPQRESNLTTDQDREQDGAMGINPQDRETQRDSVNQARDCVLEDVDGEEQADSYQTSNSDNDQDQNDVSVNKYNIPMSLTNFLFVESIQSSSHMQSSQDSAAIEIPEESVAAKLGDARPNTLIKHMTSPNLRR